MELKFRKGYKMVSDKAILVRQLNWTDSDLDQILSIETSSFNSHDAYCLEDFRSWFMRNPDLFLVAEIDGRIAGYGISRILADKADLASLAIHPEYRRRGVGSAMLEETVRRVKAYGIPQITLEVRKTNEDGFRFWKKMGFVPTGELPGFYEDGETAIQMRRRI